MNGKLSFIEHYVPREQGRVYARDYKGAGPAFVLMHGFPDNLHIYDDLIPYLVASGRRVVTFDFLGFGATKSLAALAGAIAQSPEQFGWLLDWQKQRFLDALPNSQKEHYEEFLGPLIADNFIKQPSSGPAFVQMISQFFEELARNLERLPELEALDIPVKLIWEEADPYLTVSVAEERRSHLKHPSLHVLAAGHWLQSDVPQLVAKAMLS